MSTITRYVIVDEDGVEELYEYDSYDDAIHAAMDRSDDRAVIERTYEYSDSMLVWTPDGSDTWPPEDQDEEDA